MIKKPSWDSFFVHKNKADPNFLQDRSPVVAELCCMDGKIEFNGKDYYVVIPHELLDRAEMLAGDEVEVTGESLPSGYRITIERSSSGG